MIPFDQQFSQANSFEIKYNGKIINGFFDINRKGAYTLRFTFIEINSPFNQAIVIFLNDFKGKFIVNGEESKIPKNRFPKFNFWQDTAPKQFDVGLVVEEGSLTICNGSDPIGTKQICHSISQGCAMIIERLEKDRFKFHCNDHENDDDFDDLVFEMEII